MLTVRWLALAVVAAVWLAPPALQAQGKKDSDTPLVVQIAVGRVAPLAKRGRATKPTVIKTLKQLEKLVTAKEVRQKILKKVDLDKQYLLVFAWAGSGQDRITATEKKPNKVIFHYKRGRTRDLRRHFKVFAVRKKASWKIATRKFGIRQAVRQETSAVKEIELRGLARLVKVSPKARVFHPKVARNAAELAKIVTNKEALMKISKQVNFKKKQLLVFRWDGSGGDRLTTSRQMADDGKFVFVFTYRAGATDDLKQHAKIFVLPGKARWRVVKK